MWPGRGRNQRCGCGSGLKAKFCCGVQKGPSDSEMAKAFLAGLARPAARVLARCADHELEELFEEMVEDLPRLDSSVQVRVPRLVTPDVDAFLEAVEDDDPEALEAALPAVLARVDTPLERARLARAVLDRRDAGQVRAPVAAVAVWDLASRERSALVVSGLMRSAAVMLGTARTPGGLLVAS